ncbi:MAG: peptidylprolyl isomerase [Verrucomicrobia bacterium]|nr:peptidylprolyl isomerase [Verrucomicrobiota bacterium]
MLGILAAYLIGDLFVFRGPLSHIIQRSNSNRSDVVARVGKHFITHSQLERAMRENVWLEGKSFDALNASEKKQTREKALDELIDQALLREKIAADSTSIHVSNDEINARLRAMLSRFTTKGEMEKSMRGQGIANESELRARVAARIQQEKWIEAQIAPMIRVNDEEARAWFDQNAASMAASERIEARHIFMAAMDHSQAEIDARLSTALNDLKYQRKDFATLAREINDDPASKERGGSLGWMTKSRLPADFATAVFAMPIGQPAIIRSSLGSHLVEVTAHKAAEAANFEEMKLEVIAALEAVKRRQAITELREKIRGSAAKDIRIFHSVIGDN